MHAEQVLHETLTNLAQRLRTRLVSPRLSFSRYVRLNESSEDDSVVWRLRSLMFAVEEVAVNWARSSELEEYR